MHLKVIDILEFPSLKDSILITGANNLKLPVTDAIIMEALDIEEWGKNGQILLTSYYAFKYASSQKIDTFFELAKRIGIAGFIFKMDRLVNEIPEDFISKCKHYNFPLIQISKQVTYPVVIKEILSAIVNQNTLLMNFYYENHQRFLKLMMQQADVKTTLQTLQDLIKLPVTLIEKTEHSRISSDVDYDSFDILRDGSINTRRTFHYKNILINYGKQMKERTVLSFSIPNLGYEEYELIVHSTGENLSDLQFMAIENAVVALQTEFVQRYAIRQNKYSYLNDITSELIFGRLTSKTDIDDIIYNLGLNSSLKYRVVIYNFKIQVDNYDILEFNRFTDKVINLSKKAFNKLIYVKQPKKIIFIVPIYSKDSEPLKNKLLTIIDTVNEYPLHKQNSFKITISDEKSIYDLPSAYKQAMDIRSISDFSHSECPIVAYDDIGISKLFIETENPEALKQFVPEKIWELQDKNPDLLKTLYTFINANQNYSEAAKLLFVHPKTVRYRVNQLIEQYEIEFDQPDKILYYNIAIRIILFTDYRKDYS